MMLWKMSNAVLVEFSGYYTKIELFFHSIWIDKNFSQKMKTNSNNSCSRMLTLNVYYGCTRSLILTFYEDCHHTTLFSNLSPGLLLIW